MDRSAVPTGAFGELFQHGDGLGGTLVRHEEVIVVEAGDDVAAQARFGQCRGDGGGEADGVQARSGCAG